MSEAARVVAAQISAAPDPLYLQVYEAIRDAIHTGRLGVGDRLPTERTFCQQLGVSRATVRRALRQLVDEGALEAAVGRGYFVSGAVLTEPPNALMSFTELAAARGLTPTARVLGEALRPATPEEAHTFAIDVHELVFELERLRFLDDVPVAVDRTRIPQSVAPGLETLDFADASIYAQLSSSGAAPVRADVVVSAASADSTRASQLEIAIGAPLILFTSISQDAGGRAVEIGEITYRADRYQFRATLIRQVQVPIGKSRPTLRG
jgi:GntR family transcriptional regulator